MYYYVTYTFVYNIMFLGFFHLVYCEEKELNIVSETNYISLWPFTFFPWLLSLALCPIQYLNASLGLLNFSPTISDPGVSITILNANYFFKFVQ